jgi:hypothetical protein
MVQKTTSIAIFDSSEVSIQWQQGLQKHRDMIIVIPKNIKTVQPPRAAIRIDIDNSIVFQK